MTATIPVFKPELGMSTLKAVIDALDVGWLGMGATTQRFEQKLAQYLELDGRHVLAVNTGTSALHLGLLGAGVGPGDEVIVPSFNFIADIQAVIACGAEPVFCDIRDDNLGIDVEQAARLVSPRTKALLPLHFAGIPCDIEGVHALARRHGLRVVEDATHAFGTRVAGRPIGATGDLTCFSFDPVKLITSIDGGALVTPDAETLERVRHMRLLGIDSDTTERYKNRRAWDYRVVSVGFRYHMTNINAAIGLSQLERVERFIAARQRACRRYSELLADVPGVTTPRTDFDDVGPFIYTIRVADGRRAALIDFLRTRGIDAGIHFLPCHSQPLCRNFRRGPMRVTEQASSEIMTLPLHSGMDQETVERVAQTVADFFRRDAGGRAEEVDSEFRLAGSERGSNE